MSVSVCFAECEEFNRLTDGPDNIIALVDALEKAQTINAAAEKLVRCKGRYHSEQNYRALAALFGVNIPDLPPLEHENVHYADAAEMEIAALRQRIAELESSGIASGILRCTECSFVQTKNIISISPDAIVIGNSKPEPCPNGCGSLQPVTGRRW